MKTTYTLLIYIALLLGFAACQDGNDFGDGYSARLTPGSSSGSSNTDEEHYITPSTNTLTFGAEASSSAAITYSANVSFTISVSDTWLSAISSGGLLKIAVEENTSAESRTATITLKETSSATTRGGITRAGLAEATITVTQAGTEPFINTVSTLSFEAAASSTTIDVNANVSYTVNFSETWLTTTKSSDGTKLTVSVEQNTSSESRTAIITLEEGSNTRSDITRAGSAKTTITVTQAGRETPLDFFYEIGAESNWSDSHALYDHDSDGVYEGYYYLNGDFIFKSNQNGFDGIIYYSKSNGVSYNGELVKSDMGGHNCQANPGFYKISLDLNTMTYSLMEIETISIIGEFNSWGDDVDMTYNVADGCWEAITTIYGDFKFRANHNWDNNWGLSQTNDYEHLVINGNQLQLSAGTYKFQLYLSYDGNHRVVITKVDTDTRSFTITGNGKTITFNMKSVEGGTFYMGSDAGESDESPTHKVTFTKDYYMGETEVTQALWYAVMGQSPTSDDNKWSYVYGLGDNYPAYYISYEDCQQFLTKLHQMTGQQFRFPTEAEWEFAAKGGTKSKGYTFAGSNTIDDVAWYSGNSGDLFKGTQAVKTKQLNELGLYDMSGNVWEWCFDWYGSYSASAQTDPTGPTSGSYRVFRGGSWFSASASCRCAYRGDDSPSHRFYYQGFRLAL